MIFGIPTLSGCHKLKIKNKVWLRADSVSQNIPTEETLPLYTGSGVYGYQAYEILPLKIFESSDCDNTDESDEDIEMTDNLCEENIPIHFYLAH